MVWKEVSLEIKKRFPTDMHVLKSGLMTESEYDRYSTTTSDQGQWFLPVRYNNTRCTVLLRSTFTIPLPRHYHTIPLPYHYYTITITMPLQYTCTVAVPLPCHYPCYYNTITITIYHYDAITTRIPLPCHCYAIVPYHYYTLPYPLP